MPHPRKSRFSISTKVALGIVVVVAIVALLYYNPKEISFGGLGSVKIGLPNIFPGAVGGERLSFIMTSSESFLRNEVNLQDATLTIKGTHTADAALGDSVFESANKNSEIAFQKFNGKMTVSGRLVSVEGSAAGATLDGSKIRPKSASFAVAAKLVPESYSISPVTIDRLALAGVYGSVERLGDESGTIQLSNSTVEISAFQGGVVFDGSAYRLVGSAVEIKGKSFTLKG